MKNTMIRGSVLAGLCLCAQCIAITHSATAQPFTTVINVPTDPTPDPAFIGSDTQLNLFDGGTLLDTFNLAGTLHGPNTNIEVNINGGDAGNRLLVGIPEGLGTNSDVRLNVNSGTVGSRLSVSDGATVNINGGTVGDWLEVNAGGTVNLNGGTLGDYVIAYNGSTVNINGGSIGKFFEPHNNTTINIKGGTIGDSFHMGYDTTLSISGGVFEGPAIHRGGILNLSGGNFDSFYWQSNEVHITGSEFRFNGEPVPGLASAGDSIVFDPPEPGVLTTTFADGAVFIRGIRDPLNLYTVAAPAKPAVINSPAEIEPLGLRAGQTLNLNTGAELVDYFTALDSTLNIRGGRVGRRLTMRGTTVNISDGSVGEYFYARANSRVHISGGQVEYGMYLNDSYARITGGDVKSLDVIANSIADIFGGSIENIDAHSGGIVNLTGQSFILDGVDITPGLTPGSRFTITDRDVVLEGILADGSPFSLNLQTTNSTVSNNFATTATLNVILVPEPGALVVLGAGGVCLIRRKSTR